MINKLKDMLTQGTGVIKDTIQKLSKTKKKKELEVTSSNNANPLELEEVALKEKIETEAKANEDSSSSGVSSTEKTSANIKVSFYNKYKKVIMACMALAVAALFLDEYINPP